MKKPFIIFEGINGCGKGVAVETAVRFLEEKGLKGFDTVSYSKQNNSMPEPEEAADYDFVITAEPSHSWLGAAIRNEIFYTNGRDYDESTTLNAFALDRHIQFKRLILPLKEMGKIIIQDRGFFTTFAIQPLRDGKVKWEDILNHIDHQIVLENLPDTLVIINTSPERAQQFINARSHDKQQHDRYEQLSIQQKMWDVYNSDRFKEEFKSRGVDIVYLDNNSTVEDLEVKVYELLERVFEEV